VVTSSAVVGSSAISSTGSRTSAMAIMMRWRWPPESWCGKLAYMRSRVGQPTRQHGDLIFGARGGVEQGVRAQHLVDLVAAGHDRVERRHRLLEDHRHARAAQLAQPRLRWRARMSSPCSRISPAGPAAPWQQAHHACAITDLPEPDSPTRQTISPGLTVKLTLRTAWPVAALGQARRSSTEVADVEDRVAAMRSTSDFLGHLRVERVAQTVAQDVDRQHRHRQEDAGKRCCAGTRGTACGPRP
jgi:hypothetical protein